MNCTENGTTKMIGNTRSDYINTAFIDRYKELGFELTRPMLKAESNMS